MNAKLEAATDRRSATVTNLRLMADFIEANPNIPLPWGIYVTAYVSQEEAREGRRGTFGWVKENPSNATSYVEYTKTFDVGDEPNSCATLALLVSKTETCEKVQIGTRHIEAHDEPVFEWRCTPEES